MAATLLKFAKSTTDFVSDVQGGKYSQETRDDEAVKELLKKMDRARNAAIRTEELMRKGISFDLVALNNFSENVKDTFGKLGKPSEIRNSLKTLKEEGAQLSESVDDLVKFISNDFSVLGMIDTVFKDLISVVSGVEQGVKVLDKFDKIDLVATGTWGKRAMDFREANEMGIAVSMTIVIDIANIVVQTLEVAQCYGQIQANYAEYNKNLEILSYIASNTSLPEYTRNAAWELLKMFNNGNANWDEFDKQVRNAQAKQILAGDVKLAFDVVFSAAGVVCPAVGVVKTVFDKLKSEFFDGYADTLFATQVYYSLVKGSSTILGQTTNFITPYFEFDGKYRSKVINCAITLSQARIVGLNAAAEYIISGNFIRGIINLFGGYEEEKRAYREAIRRVYEFANSCLLEISPNLPGYYSEYNEK